jgi:hypothetical protein
MLDPLEELLELYPDLEELFEALDITPYEVLQALLTGGHIVLPDYLERDFVYEGSDSL